MIEVRLQRFVLSTLIRELYITFSLLSRDP